MEGSGVEVGEEEKAEEMRKEVRRGEKGGGAEDW